MNRFKRIRLQVGFKLTPRFVGAYLLPDGRHAMYLAEGSVYFLRVIALNEAGTYDSDMYGLLIAQVDDSRDDSIIAKLYDKLQRISAYELITTFRVDDDVDDAVFLLINEWT